MMQTFSSLIFVNCIFYVYVVLDPPLQSVYIQTWREMIVIKSYKSKRRRQVDGFQKYQLRWACLGCSFK